MVDNFQREEAEIIVILLVQSNKTEKGWILEKDKQNQCSLQKIRRKGVKGQCEWLKQTKEN
jgi:hypothetical protein